MKRTKIKQVKKTLNNDNLITMFNQMMGEGDIDVSVVAPKYDLIMEKLNKIIGLIRTIFIKTEIPEYVAENFDNGISNFRDFCLESEVELEKFTIETVRGQLSKEKMELLNSDKSLMEKYLLELDDKYDRDELKAAYFGLKESTIIGRLIIAAKDIKNALQSTAKSGEPNDLEFRDSLSSNFIMKCDGDYIQLIPSITILDFKQLFINESVHPDFKTKLLFTLHVLMKHTRVIIDEITRPDINISDFASAFIENIDQIRKIPELRGCDGAFNKIANSVELLEDNFGGYYKAFAVSKNPSVIIENFVMDVAQDKEFDLKTTVQFKKIVNFYRKQMKGNADPRISKMLDLVTENINILEE